MREKPEDAQPVVHAHNHDSLFREHFTILTRLGRRACSEASAINPDHYREMSARGRRGSPYIQIQTILARPAIAKRHIAKNIALHAARAELRSLFHALPVRGGLRRSPSK